METLYTETSSLKTLQDYAKKSQRNCTFMNSASGKEFVVGIKLEAYNCDPCIRKAVKPGASQEEKSSEPSLDHVKSISDSSNLKPGRGYVARLP
jgi:hypothetical protein